MSKSKAVVEEKPIDRTCPNWTEFIINDLSEEEMFEGIPRMDGLRRMIEKHISPIVKTYVSVNPVVGQTLTIVATATIELENGEIHTACSDASPYGISDEFKYKLTALADTRAKSKAYREILRLQNTFTTDETNLKSQDAQTTEYITYPQKLMLGQKLKKLGINLAKIIQYYNISEQTNVDKLKLNECVTLMGKLDAIDKGREKCPEEVKE